MEPNGQAVFGDEAAACSEVEDKVMMHSKFEDEATKCSGPGLRKASCGSVAVFGAIEEQAVGGFKKFLGIVCVRERARGLKF
jgi:hypothetical protein